MGVVALGDVEAVVRVSGGGGFQVTLTSIDSIKKVGSTLRSKRTLLEVRPVAEKKKMVNLDGLMHSGWLSGGFTPCRHLRPSSGRNAL